MAIETPARIAILGAGPVGLEAALYGRYLGYEVSLYERGHVADHVRQWGHVRMVTPFGLNRSPLGMAALAAQKPGWTPPDEDALLTGEEFIAQYLAPLSRSDLLADGLHEQTQIEAVGRAGLLKGQEVDSSARGDREFRLLLATTQPDGHVREHVATADAVIDCTGTFGNHNWLGTDGLPAIGELDSTSHIEYRLPDILGRHRDRYASRNVLLVGSGIEAATNMIALSELASQAPDTWITWITPHACDERSPEPVIAATDARLARQNRLASVANRLAADDANHVTFYSETTVDAVIWHPDLERFAVSLTGKHGGDMEFDRVIANVGYRPDATLCRELQFDACHATEAPAAVGRARSAARGGSGPIEPFVWNAATLCTPEPDYYVLGAKSFGRDSGFLIHDGLNQIRALFAILGDREDLDLYATMKGLY